eukprot:gene2408-15693_t
MHRAAFVLLAATVSAQRWSRVPAADGATTCAQLAGPFCFQPCKGDADCNQADGCMVCALNRSVSEKNCITRDYDCGGQPAPPHPS